MHAWSISDSALLVVRFGVRCAVAHGDEPVVARDVQRVHVMQLSWQHGSYTSIHRTPEGAEQRLTEKAEALGIDLQLIEEGIDTVNSYGLSLLEVED